MKIVQVLSSVSREGAGVMDAVRSSCLYMHGIAGIEMKVLSLDDAYTSQDAHCWDPIQVETYHRWAPAAFGYSHLLKKALATGDADLIHSHGLWMHPGLAAHGISKQKGIPHVVTPHGMLEPWSVNRSYFKKWPVWWAGEKARIKGATVLHATAPSEADNFRKLGLRNPIAVIPCGVDLLELKPVSRQDLVRTVVFLSRIHPKKGLLNLVQAWAALRPEGWKVIIAGPSQNGHEDEIKAAVASAGLKAQFEFPGPVYGNAKWDLLRQADLFILPTYSENFGIAIAEALAVGVPVITTHGAPWADLEERKCGWWVKIGSNPLAVAMHEAMALTDTERHEMGLRGRRLVEEKYSWPEIAKQMVSVYEWILASGSKPDCIRLD